jgi:hypothetical protein
MNFYPFFTVYKVGKITHFLPGKIWVICQWEDVNVHQYREWGSSYRANSGVKNGLLSSQNGYFWQVILDISE